jgi:hypothetical protein
MSSSQVSTQRTLRARRPTTITSEKRKRARTLSTSSDEGNARKKAANMKRMDAKKDVG